jgi:hypothetical protein
MLRGSSLRVGTCSSTPAMVPSKAINNMSNGMHVLCIQNERGASLSHRNSIPPSEARLVRYIRPRCRAWSVCANSTCTTGRPGASKNVTRPSADAVGESGAGGHFAAGGTRGAGCCDKATTQESRCGSCFARDLAYVVLLDAALADRSAGSIATGRSVWRQAVASRLARQ